jgi:hypothetical protein
MIQPNNGEETGRKIRKSDYMLHFQTEGTVY